MNPAKNFINRRKKVETEMHVLRLTKREVAHLEKWAESLNISFEDAIAFAVYLGLSDSPPEYWNDLV